MQRIDLDGAHTHMSPEEIETWYEKLREEHSVHLSKYGVTLPTKGTGAALWLVFLRKNIGKLVHKDTISTFVATVKPKAGKDQQVRHLSGKYGWYVLNTGDRFPGSPGTVPNGYHVLISTEQPKATFLFKALKRAGRIAAKDFGQLKATYDFRCATCGSQEGKPHFLEPDKKTTLQQGHKDPSKKLTLENSIPQCQVCNQVYQDDFVFDDKGRVVAVASLRPVLRASNEVKVEIIRRLESDKDI